MRRREVLALSTVPLTGCATGSRTSTTDTDAGRLPLNVGLTRMLDEMVPMGVRYTVDVVHEQITREQTATLSISVKNILDEPVDFLSPDEFPYYDRLDTTFSYGLLPTDYDINRRSPTCAEPRSGEGAFAKSLSVDADDKVTLNPGESMTTERNLWSTPDAPRCMPTGKWTFLNGAISFWGPDDSDGCEFSWGFVLNVQENSSR